MYSEILICFYPIYLFIQDKTHWRIINFFYLFCWLQVKNIQTATVSVSLGGVSMIRLATLFKNILIAGIGYIFNNK